MTLTPIPVPMARFRVTVVTAVRGRTRHIEIDAPNLAVATRRAERELCGDAFLSLTVEHIDVRRTEAFAEKQPPTEPLARSPLDTAVEPAFWYRATGPGNTSVKVRATNMQDAEKLSARLLGCQPLTILQSRRAE